MSNGPATPGFFAEGAVLEAIWRPDPARVSWDGKGEPYSTNALLSHPRTKRKCIYYTIPVQYTNGEREKTTTDPPRSVFLSVLPFSGAQNP